MDASDTTPDHIEEATIRELHRAMETGDLTARELTRWYVDRIERFDDRLGAFVRTAPDAVERAAALDERFDVDGFVGPVHGIPVVVKDNVDVAGTPTTAGSLVLADAVPPDDATLVRRLRQAGAIVLGKANLDDFARDWHGWSTLDGQTHNPYDADRSPGGSSAGTAAAVAANLAAVGIGTDTGGSVRLPAAFTNLVGLRPTTGLVSRDGIVPISLSHDTAGPMTRTVADAAAVLDAIAGADSSDPATARHVEGMSRDHVGRYVDHLREDGLADASLGLLTPLVDGAENGVESVVDAAASAIEGAGASVEGVTLSGVDLDGFWSDLAVVDLEFKRDLNAYLDDLDGDDVPGSLADVVGSDGLRDDFVERFRDCADVDVEGLPENEAYQGRIDGLASLREELLAAMDAADLDAIVYPTCAVVPPRIGDRLPVEHMHTTLAAAAGLPAITVPAGFTSDGRLPVGFEFLGRPFEEPRLVELAYAYERRTGHRRPPKAFGADND